jgi:hypothetical protein
MQTLNFDCSFCDKRMAVGLNLLGRNVRCPHCKQVVQAPASAAAALAAAALAAAATTKAPAIAEQPAPTTEMHENGFNEAPDENPFGKTSMQTLVEAPPVVAPPPEDPFPNPLITETYGDGAPTHLSRQLAWPEPSPPLNLPADAPAKSPLETRASPAPKAIQPAGRNSGSVLMWMLFGYALIATAAAAYFFYDRNQSSAKQMASSDSMPHPYLAIPDLFGQYDRAERRKVAQIEGMPAANLAIPEQLQVKLHQTLAVGDLEVMPLSVQCRRVAQFRKAAGQTVVNNSNPDAMLYLLQLKLKNTSSDVFFCPTDPAFTRRRGASAHEVPPYSGLAFGNQLLPGGPFVWPEPNIEYEYCEGQEDDAKPLGPKQERTVVIGADMDVARVRKLLAESKENHSPIMWRVQLRRGLERVLDASGKSRDISVSSVIGVKLDAADVPN